jgi:hypothetical protein
MTLLSRPLEPDDLEAGMRALPGFCRGALGKALVTAFYEFGCNLPGDLLYLPIRVGTQWMDRFIKDSLDQRIVVPGRSDLRFVVEGGRLEALFCHEGDIHLKGTDSGLLKGFMSWQPFDGFGFETQEDAA